MLKILFLRSLFVHFLIVASTAQMTSVWLVVLVTWDRYQAICNTMSMGSKCSLQRVRLYIFILLLGAVSFNIPTAFDLRVLDRRAICPNVAKLDAFPTRFFQNKTYDLVYKTVLTFVLRTALPLILVIAMNSRIVSHIRKSNEFRALGKSRPKVGSMNRMVAMITLVFVICETPDFIFRIIRAVKFYNRTFPMTWKQYAEFAQVSNLFLTFNSSTNFIWYCFAGTKFREILLQSFCKCGSKNVGRPVLNAMDTQSKSRSSKSSRLTSLTFTGGKSPEVHTPMSPLICAPSRSSCPQSF